MKKIAGIFVIALIASVTTIGVYSQLSTPTESIQIITETKTEGPEEMYHLTHMAPGPETRIDFTTAAANTVNTVVHVKTIYEGETVAYSDPFYEFLWGKSNPKKYKTPDRRGSGSGVILSEDGYIVTNNHVIDGANNIQVTLNNQRTYTAEVIGSDPSTDLALLKIDARDMDYIQFANSDHVQVGEWVLAVGNPYNLTSTVTAGIVSAKGRNIGILRDKFKIESFIQTDAAVNPGNSGGALVNTRGELVGINSAIASPTGSYSGYSFAIPVNMVQKVVTDLKEFGSVQRAYIGITIKNLTGAMADDLGLDKIDGVYVSGLQEKGAAKLAGIKVGDVIRKVESVEVKTVPELQEQVSRFRPGDNVVVTLVRGGELMAVRMTLKNRFGTTKLSVKDPEELILLGATFEPISEELKSKLSTDHGVQITKLERGKFSNAGVKQGYIITRIDKKPIHSSEEVAKALESKRGGILIEGIYPNGREAHYGFGI
ncbi:MAG: Do family serine endopeptidase [Flavobacteriales bacterium]|nr:Do family serine endopeptidase [Flavobacteriales bacterium]